MANELTQKQVTSNVAHRIEEMKGEGLLIAPNYSVSNALSSAYHALKNSSSGNLLAQCTPDSIYNALQDMVTQGLSPAKSQCYFIKYSNEVKLNRSYFGTMKVVKQLPEVKDIWAEVIYEGDNFEVEVVDGQKQFKLHETSWKNQDNPIEGAYCIIEDIHGVRFLTVMTKKEIDKSWSKARTKNVQNDFPQEMAKRTVINRAAKRFFNTSDDNSLFIDAVARTTSNEFEEDRKTKDVTPSDSNNTLSDFLNAPEATEPPVIEDKGQVDNLPQDKKEAEKQADMKPSVASSYPAEEVPDFLDEISEQESLFGSLEEVTK